MILRLAKTLIICLTLLSLGSCGTTRGRVYGCVDYWTTFNRPVYESVKWEHAEDGKRHTLTTVEAKKLLNNNDKKDSYIETLEGRISIMERLICSSRR